MPRTILPPAPALVLLRTIPPAAPAPDAAAELAHAVEVCRTYERREAATVRPEGGS